MPSETTQSNAAHETEVQPMMAGPGNTTDTRPRLLTHKPMTRLNTPRLFATACCLGSHIYVIGGARKGPTVHGVGPTMLRLAISENLIPAAGPWEELPQLPTSRWALGSAVVNNRIYVIGGFCDVGDRNFVDTVECYDPAANRWTTVRGMPTPRNHVACVAVGNKIHAIGGNHRLSQGVGPGPVHEVYDTVNDRWETLPSAPAKLSGHSCVVINGKIYAVGGLGPDLVYDLNTHQWSQLAQQWPCESKMRDTNRAVAAVGTSIIMFGSCRQHVADFDRKAWCYDTISGQWSLLSKGSLAQAKGAACAAVKIGPKNGCAVYVMGGAEMPVNRDPIAEGEFYGFQITSTPAEIRAAMESHTERTPVVTLREKAEVSPGAQHQTEAHPTAIYGTDNRREVADIHNDLRKTAAASACALVEFNMIDIKDGWINFDRAATLADKLQQTQGGPAAASVRFSNQRCPAFGSAFLVGNRIIATSAHNIHLPPDFTTCKNLEEIFCVFGWQTTGGNPPARIPLTNVYRVVQVLKYRFKLPADEGTEDWALLQLDRNVSADIPLAVFESSEVGVGNDLWMVGHPEGLPAKYDDEAKVTEIPPQHTFVSDLDIFQGNSGSPVFNSSCHVVGVAYRGPAVNWVKNARNEVEAKVYPAGTRAVAGSQKINMLRTLMKGDYKIALVFSDDFFSGTDDAIFVGAATLTPHIAFRGPWDAGKSYPLDVENSHAPTMAEVTFVSVRKAAHPSIVFSDDCKIDAVQLLHGNTVIATATGPWVLGDNQMFKVDFVNM